jgi:hypothetical protein
MCDHQQARKSIWRASLILAIVIGNTSCTNAQKRESVLSEVASRLNVKADWDMVRYWVYCDAMNAGTQRPLVESNLERVGKFRKNGKKGYDEGRKIFSERYVFEDQFIYEQLGDLRALYDAQDILTARWRTEQDGLDAREVKFDCVALKAQADK